MKQTPPTKYAEDAPRILVRSPNWLGDLVLSLDFFSQLRRRWPNARIEAIAPRHLASLLNLVPDVDAAHPFAPLRMPLPALWRFSRSLGRADYFFVLPGSFASGLMARLTQSTRRIGFRGDGRSPLLTDALPFPRGIHRAHEYVQLLRPFCPDGVVPNDPRIVVKPDEAVSAWSAEKGIALNIHSEASSRRMPLTHWTDVAQRLVDTHGFRLVLTGGPRDVARSREFSQRIHRPDQTLDMTGSTSVAGLAAVFSSVRLVVSMDSGPAHLANAVGTPLVVIFGAGDPAHTGPLRRENTSILRVSGLDCMPCERNVCPRKTGACLALLTPDTIISECLTRLEMPTG